LQLDKQLSLAKKELIAAEMEVSKVQLILLMVGDWMVLDTHS